MVQSNIPITSLISQLNQFAHFCRRRPSSYLCDAYSSLCIYALEIWHVDTSDSVCLMSEWPTYSIQLRRGIFHSWSLWPQVSFSVSLSVSHTITHNPKEIFPTRQWSKTHTVTHAQPRTQCPSSQGASQSDSWGINSRLAKVSPERNGPGVVDQRSLLKCQNLLRMNFHLSYHCKEKLHGIPLMIITKHTARIWHPNITPSMSSEETEKKSEKLVFNKCPFLLGSIIHMSTI